MSSTDLSAKLFADACAVIPGGVNSPVRAFTSVGGTPRFITSGQGLLADRRRRQPLRRPGVLVGSDDPRAMPTRPSSRPSPQAAAHGLSFGAPTPAEIRTGRRDHRPGGPRRAGPAGELRHRGHHERGPAGPRVHRPPQGRQVLRLLPRPRRRAARRRRLRGGDAGPAVLAGCHRRHRRRHDRVALQRHRRRRADVRRARRPDRRRHHRGQPRQHGCRPAAAGLQRRAAARSPPSTARC